MKSVIYNFVFPDLYMARLEILIEQGWEKGIKWAKSLGFKREGVLECYGYDYKSYIVFTRIDKRWQQAQP